MSQNLQLNHTFSCNLNCIVCQNNKIKKLILYPCHHFICQDCIVLLVKEECPICKERIIFSIDLFNNKFLNMQVSCPHTKCDSFNIFMPPYILQKHLDEECEFGENLCICGYLVPKIYFSEHIKKECPDRDENCKFCGVVCPFKNLFKHQENVCKEIEIDCKEKYRGCEYHDKRYNTTGHEFICEYSFIRCPTDSCEVQGLRKDMKEHLNTCYPQQCENCNITYSSMIMEEHKTNCVRRRINCCICNIEMDCYDFGRHFNIEHEYSIEMQKKKIYDDLSEKALEKIWTNITPNMFILVKDLDRWEPGYVLDEDEKGKEIQFLDKIEKKIWISDKKKIRPLSDDYEFIINNPHIHIIINNIVDIGGHEELLDILMNATQKFI